MGGPEILSFSELMKKMLTVIIDMFKKEHRDTFKNLSFAVIGMRTRIYRSLGLNEEDFFNNWKSYGNTINEHNVNTLNAN